ncbi:MAG: hypothetical protein ACRELG_02195 [Gemmataceae bacterium]
MGVQGILVHSSDTWLGRLWGGLKRLVGLGPPTTCAPRQAQPNPNALELYQNPEFKALVNNDAIDCSQLANELLEASGRHGGEMVINPSQDQIRVRFPIKFGIEQGNYHSVYCDGEFVFDPRFRDTPTPRAEYEALIRELNEGNVDINFGDRE